MERTKFDASTLSMSYCSTDGPTLCHLTRDQLLNMFGMSLGTQLYQSLVELKAKYGKDLMEVKLINFIDDHKRGNLRFGSGNRHRHFSNLI